SEGSAIAHLIVRKAASADESEVDARDGQLGSVQAERGGQCLEGADGGLKIGFGSLCSGRLGSHRVVGIELRCGKRNRIALASCSSLGVQPCLEVVDGRLLAAYLRLEGSDAALKGRQPAGLLGAARPRIHKR